MGAKKGRCAAVIAAVLLMAACIAPAPVCGLSQVETMASRHKIDSIISGAHWTPIDVYRDQLPPDVVFRPLPPDEVFFTGSEEFRATFPDGSSLLIRTTSCFDDELGLCVRSLWVE